MEVFIDLLEKSSVDTFFGLLEAIKTKYMKEDGPIFKYKINIKKTYRSHYALTLKYQFLPNF